MLNENNTENLEQFNATVIMHLYQKVAQAIRKYHQQVDWITGQFESGNIDKEKLMGIVITASPIMNTHQSPIELAIDKLYVDPAWAFITENNKSPKACHITHKAAKLLTLNQLHKSDFPEICVLPIKGLK